MLHQCISVDQGSRELRQSIRQPNPVDMLQALILPYACVGCTVLCCVRFQCRHELEMAGIGLALQAMWAANVLDIQKTLHQVRALSLVNKATTAGCRPGTACYRQPLQPAQAPNRSPARHCPGLFPSGVPVWF